MRERTDGAGEEKVLPPPPPCELIAPPTVTFVSAADDSAFPECAVSECIVPGSVVTVGALERGPVIGGDWSSVDERSECRLPFMEDTPVFALDGPVDVDRCRVTPLAEEYVCRRPTVPDSG